MATLRTQNVVVASGTSATIQLTGLVSGDTLVLCIGYTASPNVAAVVSDNVNGDWPAEVVASAPPGNHGTALYALHNSFAGDPIITMTWTTTVGVIVNASAWAKTTAGHTFANGPTNSASLTAATTHTAGDIAAGSGVIIRSTRLALNSAISSLNDGFTFLTGVGLTSYFAYKLTSGETVDGDMVSSFARNSENVIAGFTEVPEPVPTLKAVGVWVPTLRQRSVM